MEFVVLLEFVAILEFEALVFEARDVQRVESGVRAGEEEGREEEGREEEGREEEGREGEGREGEGREEEALEAILRMSNVVRSVGRGIRGGRLSVEEDGFAVSSDEAEGGPESVGGRERLPRELRGCRLGCESELEDEKAEIWGRNKFRFESRL